MKINEKYRIISNISRKFEKKLMKTYRKKTPPKKEETEGPKLRIFKNNRPLKYMKNNIIFEQLIDYYSWNLKLINILC